MDKGGPVNSGGPIMDVAFPGSTAATPSSKPVMPAQPLQADPMMAPRPSLLDSTPAAATPAPGPTPPIQVVSQEAAREQAMNDRKVDGHEIATPLHKLTHEEPIFGHVGKHKKSKLGILLVLLVLAGAAAAGYFFLFKAI